MGSGPERPGGDTGHSPERGWPGGETGDVGDADARDVRLCGAREA